MAIPKNITKEHLIKAIQKIDNEGIPKEGDSQYYDVIYKDKKYPPKVIVSYANIYANGKELDRASFSGGVDTQCFKLLEENEFIIQKKSVSYYVLGASWENDDRGPDQSARFIENGIWENGYDDKFIDLVNSVNLGDRVALKSSYATKEGKSILRIKAIGTISGNGKNGKTLNVKWDHPFIPFDLEGYGAYRNTIQKVSAKDIEVIFKSESKMNYYTQLKKFLDQANTNQLGTSEYISSFQGMTVRVSFGKGNQARIPWIAFLNGTDTVQEGIYPVYLYYKDKNLLILAYGISETSPPKRKWNISNEKTIRQYFIENNLGKPERYGSSYLFKLYDTSKSISEDEINNDLNNLISFYKLNSSNALIVNDFKHSKFFATALEAGLYINENLSARFITSLLTKPFVILTGLSGSGKTKLAQSFAMWICEDENQYRIVPVGADWTNREPLLGFPNALQKGSYVAPENGVLSLIIEASKNFSKPYFLILDEMNLSHVERYFADFLSVMESKDTLALHSGDDEWDGIPAKINFPKNLFIVGTVNIDETTYMFSPKVLDRANVIEFRVTATEMENYLQRKTDIRLGDFKGVGKEMAEGFVELANDTKLSAVNEDELNKVLINFFTELKKTGAEFGYRSASEILRFAAMANKLDATWDLPNITDAAIMQKLLPKVHGSRRKLEPILKTLGTLCLHDGEKIEDYISKSEIDFTKNTKIKYPFSLEKIIRMYQSLISNGFTSYAEA